MDPITVAANRFLREHETAWVPPPGSDGVTPAVLRLQADGAHRSDVLKALRLLEWQPENRRPFSVVEVPFADESSYQQQVLAAVEADMAKLDQGLREDGIARPSLPARLTETGPRAFSAQLETFARHVATFLDGLVVVLAPRNLGNRARLSAFLQLVAESRRSDQPLRLDVLACGCPELDAPFPVVARFAVDDAELFAFMRDLGSAESAGPAPELPPLSPERRRQIEAELGQPIVSRSAGNSIKRLLMDGGKALQEGNAKQATRKYRAARTLAQLTGLRNETLFTTMALGTAYATLKNLRGAEASFQSARQIAAELGRPDVEAQALFGLGFVFMLERRFRDAATIYQVLSETAEETSPLRDDALRLVEAARRGDMAYGAQQVQS